ncbi:MAG: ParA family protein [Bacteroidetes bacterium]|nr:ParA family protein [Bacteroidota bacterium]
MVIIIGNQKGGAGKSTLTLLLANFLTQVKEIKVTVVDMDYQQSLAQKYEKSKVLENIAPYEVIAAELEHFPVINKLMAEKPKEVLLIDLPGKLDDDGLIPIFKAADLVICPFAYDEFSYESTILFSVVLRQINKSSVIYYVPNRVKANVRYETQQDVNTQLLKIGKLAPPIPDRIDFQRTNTFMTPLAVVPIILSVFEPVYEEIKKMLPAPANR